MRLLVQSSDERLENFCAKESGQLTWMKIDSQSNAAGQRAVGSASALKPEERVEER